MKLSIFHDGQLFIGLVEYKREDSLKISKHVFGQEPSDQKILEFISEELEHLIDSTHTRITTNEPVKRVNPKRLQREVAKEQKKQKFSTMAQEAIKKEQQINKKIRKEQKKVSRDQLKDYKRSIKKLKSKEKHKGH